ncbi:MAG: hypothetical protein CME63_17550 [Halobacteriovoraceae bacterium]|nr:hypothetical protein [Halobacteriovoraceae bacterium]MBC99554.1 hypothetical protein [Halobacteriovoraceae bacterium]|tara:strand:- start:27204 stop:27626 length:423 start_codon:yes stop_codon:yes gene_type:complete
MTLWALVTWQTVHAVDDGPVFKKKKFNTPKRDQSIIVTPEGYYPESFSVFKGERIRFFVTATSDQKECFIIKGKEIFLSAEKGKVSEGSVIFNRPGVYQYYCPTTKHRGSITVMERPEVLRERKRALASETVKVWMPREE